MTEPLRSSAPGPREFEEAEKKTALDAVRRAAAAPWRQALLDSFPADHPDREALADVLFRITYKHYDPARHTGRALRLWAEEISRAPFRAAESRGSIGENVSVLEQLEAVYALTNSDWASPLAPVGRGLDRVATGEDLHAWMKVLTASAKKALADGMDPKSLWRSMTSSGRVQTPEDVEKSGLNPPPPPRF